MPIARFQEDATTAIVRTVGAANADITLRDHFCKAHGPKTLARAVAKEADPRRFQRLAMEKCSLGDDGAKTMASHALPALRALRGLYLCANGIGPLGAKAIASGVRLCAELHTLRLDSNRLGCSGAAALFGALPGTKIETVGMMNNGIADKGAKTLAKVLARCTALRAVNLDANCITDSSCRALMLALPRSTLGELGLAYNNITERGEKMVERGRVAQAREYKIRETFDTIDEDGSGELDKDEVAAMTAALGAPLIESLGSIHLSNRKLDEAFAQMDPNGDGAVSFAEFREWYGKYVPDDPANVPEEPEPEPEAEPEPEPADSSQDGDSLAIPTGEEEGAVEAVWERRRASDARGVAGLLLAHPRSVAVAESGCWALRLLLTEARDGSAEDLQRWFESDALQVLRVVMATHPASSAVQQHVCHVARLVASEPEVAEEAGDLGYCEGAIEAMRGTKLAGVHEQAAAALRELSAASGANQARIGEHDGVEALVRSLRLHGGAPNIVTHITHTL